VRDHEPRLALVPGPTGNEAYEAVARAAAEMLPSGGLLALELGWRSEEAVRGLVAREGFGDLVSRPDLQGIPRVLTARQRRPPLGRGETPSRARRFESAAKPDSARGRPNPKE